MRQIMSNPIVKADCVEVLVTFPHDNSDESLLDAVRNALALTELATKSIDEQNKQNTPT